MKWEYLSYLPYDRFPPSTTVARYKNTKEMVRCNRGTGIVMLVFFIDSEFLYNIQANVSNKAWLLFNLNKIRCLLNLPFLIGDVCTRSCNWYERKVTRHDEGPNITWNSTTATRSFTGVKLMTVTVRWRTWN